MGKGKEQKRKAVPSLSTLSKDVKGKFITQNKTERKKIGSRKPVQRTVSIRVDYGSAGGANQVHERLVVTTQKKLTKPRNQNI